jgi:cell division protein FtsW (lipid II flippase)
VATLFHFLFKGLALFFYMFGGFFSTNFVFICVVCILLLAFDFWTVKNVTGRLLVGLRWWNNVKDDGTNDWVFESIENPNEIHPTDAKLFWTGLYVTPILWVLFLLVALLKFNIQWLVIVLVALVLSGANIVGYYKCSKDQQKKVNNYVQDSTLKVALGVGTSAVQSFMASAFGGMSGQQAQGQAPQAGRAQGLV